MAQINQPAQPQQPYSQKEEKEEFWDKLLKGLQIANAGMGIAVDWQKINAFREESAAKKAKAAVDAEQKRIFREQGYAATDEGIKLQAAEKIKRESDIQQKRELEASPTKKQELELEKSKVDLETAGYNAKKAKAEYEKELATKTMGKPWGSEQEKGYKSILNFDSSYENYKNALNDLRQDPTNPGKIKQFSSQARLFDGALAQLMEPAGGRLSDQDIKRVQDARASLSNIYIDKVGNLAGFNPGMVDGALRSLESSRQSKEASFYKELAAGGYRGPQEKPSAFILPKKSSNQDQKHKFTPEQTKAIDAEFKKQFGF